VYVLIHFVCQVDISYEKQHLILLHFFIGLKGYSSALYAAYVDFLMTYPIAERGISASEALHFAELPE
jgi:hypothetical protein